MRELPMLFNGPMVRAVLNGTKTQTRRIMNPQPVVPAGASIRLYDETATHMTRRRGWQVEQPGDYDGHHVVGHLTEDRKQMNIGSMPYCAGDRLWVRETWAEVPRLDPSTDEFLPWRHDGRILVYAADPQWEGARQFLCADGVMRWAKPQRWTPSIHMPRWASRIELEVTAVRVERLRDITPADALAEGIELKLKADRRLAAYDEVCRFAALWEGVYGTGSWWANPLVWVIEFQRRDA